MIINHTGHISEVTERAEVGQVVIVRKLTNGKQDMLGDYRYNESQTKEL